MRLSEKPLSQTARAAAATSQSAVMKTPRLIGSSGWIGELSQASNSNRQSENRFNRSGAGADLCLAGADPAGLADMDTFDEMETPRVACLRAIREAYRYYTTQQQQENHLDELNNSASQNSTAGLVDKSGIKKIFGKFKYYEIVYNVMLYIYLLC